ncbi:MAG: transposase [Elusimicrobia bacterium]|nr:transposase [Elusimicrobiota bacterium]
MQKDLFVTRRNLPHWQIGGFTYFVTFRTKGMELSSAARKLVLDACLYFDGQRYVLWSAVVMPDHVHLLFQPREMMDQASVGSTGFQPVCMHSQDGCATKWWPLSRILHSIKSYTANRINKMLGYTGMVWQDESFDRIVRDEGEFLEKWDYIRNNPVKNQLAESPEKWVGFYECTGKMPVPPDGKLGT